MPQALRYRAGGQNPTKPATTNAQANIRLYLTESPPLADAGPTRGKLVFPEMLEPIGRQSRIAGRHDRAVAEIGLDGASVVAVVGELEPARAAACGNERET